MLALLDPLSVATVGYGLVMSAHQIRSADVRQWWLNTLSTNDCQISLLDEYFSGEDACVGAARQIGLQGTEEFLTECDQGNSS